ncbi:MAG: heavy-metal-associated domain-containing protein [Paludibacter sp.]|nr:heavy-metal-associated domain-containing protein [Paludibacter sp.]
MYSTFNVSKTECMTCTNKTLKSLGSLQGVFGAEIDQIDGKITVSHTDEISRMKIAEMLFSLGYPEIETNTETEVICDEPSIWGYVL